MRYIIEDQKLNETQHPTIWVVENFYKDPYTVRDFALNQEFNFTDYHRGRRTNDQFEIPGTKEAFERIMGMRIVNWADYHGMCGRFQFCTSEDALVYHADHQQWAAVVYLTPDAPYETGTSLLAHKKTGIRHTDVPGCADVIFSKGFLDPTPWDHIDVVGNVFNRLVIWDGKCPHTASKYFGKDKYDSRLFHIFFFDTE